jgi:hypothetical protein
MSTTEPERDYNTEEQQDTQYWVQCPHNLWLQSKLGKIEASQNWVIILSSIASVCINSEQGLLIVIVVIVAISIIFVCNKAHLQTWENSFLLNITCNHNYSWYTSIIIIVSNVRWWVLQI